MGALSNIPSFLTFSQPMTKVAPAPIIATDRGQPISCMMNDETYRAIETIKGSAVEIIGRQTDFAAIAYVVGSATKAINALEAFDSMVRRMT